ncbi:acyl-CoA synthase [Parvularcula bermudensis HTCC2503]|uniref:Long-chain-fatty-acid--CoA ligase n=1 Tax=Parvularcula bermudensis (strain ATCC BAA-594 / HTCC2503 / KCTC 12087) TaxID=314260 RepID=E0TFR7_PARBH|nr:AMP-binding protein [Parvularcula bermudensis]ADM09082.1 acyl-CoA synthase [Parvularcula bermudensis HTCC2503]
MDESDTTVEPEVNADAGTPASAVMPSPEVWTKSYPAGVPATVTLGEDETFTGLLTESVKKYGDKVAIRCMETDWTYRRLDEDSRAFASYLRSKGINPGDRVAIMMPTVPQYVVCLLGALRAGCVMVGVNPLYTARELCHQLEDSGAVAIIIFDQFASIFATIREKTPVKEVIVTKAGDIFGGPKGAIANLVVKYVQKKVDSYSIPGHTKYTDAIKKGRSLPNADIKRSPDEIAALQYTGGTTGVAKGAVLKERNLLAAAKIGDVWTKPGREREPVLEEQKALIPLPLYHVFTLYVVASSLGIGATCIFVPDPRDGKLLVKTMARNPFNLMIGVNRLYQGLAEAEVDGEPVLKKFVDFSNTRACISGGTPTMRSVAESWHKQTGLWIMEGWGMTETVGAGTCNPDGLDGFNGTVGLPMPSTRIEIRDDDGKALPIGERGEIWLSGPQVMAGYWKRPDETAKVMDGKGFMATGDIGIMDENGFIEIVDRKKDMILVSGFNVYPSEIEDVVDTIEGVSEVAAVGIPSERTGEAVKLFVAKSDPNLTEADIMAVCKRELTNYKRPSKIVFMDELPKSAVGKILKKELKDV